MTWNEGRVCERYCADSEETVSFAFLGIYLWLFQTLVIVAQGAHQTQGLQFVPWHHVVFHFFGNFS